MRETSTQFDAKGALALMIGATGIGLAPILVRLSETGPATTAFYRIALSLPVLWWWLLREAKSVAPQADQKREWRLAALAGFFFAADMAIWNWSLKLTTVANSTLLTNFTPLFVMAGSRVLFGERIAARVIVGMLIAITGAFLMVGQSLHLERRFLVGDGLAVVAAVFYAGYLLTVKELRNTRSAWFVMAVSGVFSATLLFLIGLALGEALLPVTLKGWVIVLVLAIVSHVGGQGLIAYGLAHISASVSSVMLMWQPVVAAVLAWILLDEPLNAARACGGLIILAGIFAATRRR